MPVPQDGEALHATRRQSSLSSAGWMDGSCRFQLSPKPRLGMDDNTDGYLMDLQFIFSILAVLGYHVFFFSAAAICRSKYGKIISSIIF
jgi:hypothetical protein